MSENRVSPIEWLATTEDPKSLLASSSLHLPPLNDREDGELSDEGSDIEDVDYNILQRPTTTSLLNPPSVGLPSSNNNSMNPSGTTGKCEEIYSDEEEALGSSSDSDSDIEPSSKRRNPSNMMSGFGSNSFRNPNASNFEQFPTVETASEAKTLCEEKMLSFQQKRKVNNVWAEVLQEEQHQQTLEKLGSIDVDNSKILVERGPESYAFKPSGNINAALKRKRNLPGSQNKKKEKKKSNPNDSDVSSTGLSDDDMEYIRKASAAQGSENPRKPTKGGKQYQLANGFAETGKMLIGQLRNLLHSLKGRKLSYFMANELDERKKQLVVRAVELLGKPYCIRMFIKTLKIERKGGLMIKNQSRRRTPGGVFFYMLRKDPKYDPEIVEQVFAIDREITAKERKTLKAARRHQRKAKLEKRLALEKLKEQNQNPASAVSGEDGEVHSPVESLASYESESSDSDDGDLGGQRMDDEISNDYLDITCESHEFDEM